MESRFLKIQDGGRHHLELGNSLLVSVFYLRHPHTHLCAKFGNRITCNEMAAYYVKFKMVAAVAILDFSCNFRFWDFSLGNHVMNMCIKFHQDPSIFAGVIAISIISRWPPPPSWIWVFTYFFDISETRVWFSSIPENFMLICLPIWILCTHKNFFVLHGIS